jgi:predicted metal-dependent enzyme (double-stranded beta helix superfamily)
MTALPRIEAAPGAVLDPVQLVEFTRFLADEVRSGRYPFVEFDPQTRWHQRIYRDPRVDVWLISWLPEQGTQLHDHGGSAGSFTVISGVLAEAVYIHSGRDAGLLREREHNAGRSIGFDRRYVHDVRNLSDAPAISVHAYSSPLTSMTFYDLHAGELEKLATLVTDDPEPGVRPTPLQ